MAHAIGIDLGGSSAKIALVAQSGAILAQDSVEMRPTPDAETVLAPVAAVVERIQRVAARHGYAIDALGCGISGYLDHTRTRIAVNNTPALNGFALASWLETRFAVPVAVDNDACVAALAETQLGGSTDKERLLFVTVGSGIGVVLIVRGTVVRVMHGVTGDASHLIVNYGSVEQCPVGCHGCLETVASARAIARAGGNAAREQTSAALARIQEERGTVTSMDVAQAAAAGDTVAQEILTAAGRWLGVGLASWASIYAPDHVLLGGGVAAAGDAWLDNARQTMRGVGVPFLVDRLTMSRATLGNRACVIGAALLALRHGG